MATTHTQISVAAHTRHYCVNIRAITHITTRILDALGLLGFELSVQFVAGQKIRALNRKFRGKDQSTDVLSFPQTEWEAPQKVSSKRRTRNKSSAPESLGDVVISLADAKRNAESIGHDLDREAAFLLVHGILHLCGHDHMNEDDEKVMLRQQKLLMAQLSGKGRASQPLWKNCVVHELGRRRA